MCEKCDRSGDKFEIVGMTTQDVVEELHVIQEQWHEEKMKYEERCDAEFEKLRKQIYETEFSETLGIIQARQDEVFRKLSDAFDIPQDRLRINPKSRMVTAVVGD